MRLLILVFLLAPSILIYSQDISYSQYKKEISEESIRNLANGALLVRLITRQKSIEKLNEFGRTADAEKLQKDVDYKNQKIREAFAEEYDFSPVYFFDANYAIDIRSGELDSVVFLNSEGERANLELEKFLIAAFSTTQPDTAAFFRGYRQVVTDKGVEQKSTYYSEKNMGLPALIIYSPELIQLTDPFPYYVRTFESLPVKRSIPKTVQKMNNKLHYYYSQNKYK